MDHVDFPSAYPLLGLALLLRPTVLLGSVPITHHIPFTSSGFGQVCVITDLDPQVQNCDRFLLTTSLLRYNAT